MLAKGRRRSSARLMKAEIVLLQQRSPSM